MGDQHDAPLLLVLPRPHPLSPQTRQKPGWLQEDDDCSVELKLMAFIKFIFLLWLRPLLSIISTGALHALKHPVQRCVAYGKTWPKWRKVLFVSGRWNSF